MSAVSLAVLVFAGLAGLVALFQIALALGAPWGHLAMGGRWPRRLPPGPRIAALVQAGLMAAMARIVAGAGGVLAPFGPDWLIWVVVAVTGLSALANNVTPSRGERRLWGPVALVMVLAAIWVASAG